MLGLEYRENILAAPDIVAFRYAKFCSVVYFLVAWFPIVYYDFAIHVENILDVCDTLQLQCVIQAFIARNAVLSINMSHKIKHILANYKSQSHACRNQVSLAMRTSTSVKQERESNGGLANPRRVTSSVSASCYNLWLIMSFPQWNQLVNSPQSPSNGSSILESYITINIIQRAVDLFQVCKDYAARTR